MQEIATLRALAAPRRRAILRLVWDREITAGEIYRMLGTLSFGAVSQHLRILEEAGLVDKRAEGKWRIYRARKEALGPFREWLETMWSDRLNTLKLAAEIEEARRGPLPRRRRRRKS